MRDLTGHSSFITGGNGGIGLGLAEGLLAAGADVAIGGRNTAKTEEAAAKLRAEYPERRVLALTCDVSEEAQVEAAVAACVAEFGQLDSCFANAGISHVVAKVWELSAEDWRRVMSVNLDGVFYTFKAAARHMVEREGGGALVGVSSTSAIHGAPTTPHYATAKTGVLGLVRSFSVALARYGVRVNALLPGWTGTDMMEPARDNQKFVENTTYRTPVRRWADPDEFGSVATFLADPSITFHTGDSLVMDGGYTIF